MMSLKEGFSECEAERKFWRLSELVENLLPFLDLTSTKELAEAHKLTRQILGRALNWDKMIKRTFPASENINRIRGALEEGDLILVRLVAQILLLAEDTDRPQMERSLLHKICGRYPKVSPLINWVNLVKLNCSCEFLRGLYFWRKLRLSLNQESRVFWKLESLVCVNLS